MGDVRCCDGRCQGARDPRCDCWCGGLFHGARTGENPQAEDNARTFAEWAAAELGAPSEWNEVFWPKQRQVKLL